jgi:hypothetical protein
MRRGEQDVARSGLMNEHVVLPMPGDTRVTSPSEVHQIDLIEGIAWLALALEDELAPSFDQ